MVKKALIVGINYEGSPHSLRGCVNDAKNVYQLLSSKYGYSDDNVRLLLDGKKDQDSVLFPTIFAQKEGKGEKGKKKQADKPTHANLHRDLQWLVGGAKAGDSLFFHFSGHGGQVKDTDGDEDDGMDEVIFPLDFIEAGPIVDDELYNCLVKKLPNGVHLTVVLDCCHSGTGLDLPFVFSTDAPNPEHKLEKKKDKKDKKKDKEKSRGVGDEKDKKKDKEKDKKKDKDADKEKDKKKDKDHDKEDKKQKKLDAKRLKKSEESKEERKKRKDGDGSSVAAEVVLFSGCLDHQTSADTSQNGQPTGALTFAFVQTLHDTNGDISYVNLLFKMRETVKKMSARITQIPQLSSNDTSFDLQSKVVL